MKKILITGDKSYVGTSVTNYLNQNYPNDYIIDEISVRDDNWKMHDFSKYDVIFHVAGIAHVSTDPKMKDLYYKVNRDLTIEVAKKSKEDNVSQFIFMSSMIVFGKPKDGLVNSETKPNPENFYGQSKLEAEKGIEILNSDDFKVVILRPPMIYGPGSKGNYPRLAKLAKITPIFPNYPNKRSMLFIDNLAIFIKDIIDNDRMGIFHPQNNEYVQTSSLVKEIANVHNHKLWTTKIFNPIIGLFKNIDLINKIFGNLYYVENNRNIEFIDFKESIKKTQVEVEIWKF